jgi:hypothetical protein
VKRRGLKKALVTGDNKFASRWWLEEEETAYGNESHEVVSFLVQTWEAKEVKCIEILVKSFV